MAAHGRGRGHCGAHGQTPHLQCRAQPNLKGVAVEHVASSREAWGDGVSGK